MANGDAAEMSFAERMMKNMGWAEGKGLGKKEEGIRDFIKPKMKFNTKGIGYMGVDHKWIAHQEHFDDLLTSLNKGERPAQPKDIACLTSTTKLKGRTKFYGKMMRGKDLSNRSSKDLSAIILPLSKKNEVVKTETTPLPSELDGTLKSSQVSMDDYFAKMMAQRKLRLNKEQDVEISSGEIQKDKTDEEPTSEKKQKKKKPKKSDVEVVETVVLSDESSELSASKGEKRKKKRKKDRETDEQETISIEEIVEENIPKKKKKKNQKSAVEEELVEKTVVVENATKTKKKKNKSEENLRVERTEEEESEKESFSQESSKKSKKSKKKIKDSGNDFEITEDGTRLNVDVELLKKIRGATLDKSKAPPLRDLSDEQIQEIHRMWTSGEYAEFMRRIHVGELPRWVAVEKSLVDRMVVGRTKLIDLADIREVLDTKWKSANVEEIWGYTNLAYLAV